MTTRPLRYGDKLKEDLALRGFSPRTRVTYYGHCRRFFDQVGLPPARVADDDVRRFLLALRQRGRSAATVASYHHALRFFFRVTVSRPEVVQALPTPRVPRQTMRVPTRDEVRRLLHHTETMRHRAWFATLYGTGVRLSELVQLQVQDLDAVSQVVRVRCGKGGKGRSAPLSPGLLALLRSYWRARRPPGPWLFPGRSGRAPISHRAVQHAFAKARGRAGLRPQLTLHSLRHACATHLLDDGVDSRTVQVLLGHARIDTTERYLHVSDAHMARVPSPLDRLLDAG